MPKYNKDTKKKIFAMHGNRCVYCEHKFDVEDLTREHVIPKSEGGTYAWSNIVPACRSCNEARANHALDHEQKIELKQLAIQYYYAFYYSDENKAIIRKRKQKYYEQKRANCA